MPRKRQEGLAGMTIAELTSKAALMDRIAEIVQESGLYGRRRNRAAKPEPEPDKAPRKRAPRKRATVDAPPSQAQERSGPPRVDPALSEAARNATVEAPQPQHRTAQPLRRAPANPRPSVGQDDEQQQGTED